MVFRFDRFHLDPNDRLLRRDEQPVELNSRYLDALMLLVRERGRLVSKDRFLDEVWRGVPVTDEALTQCIKTLRRQLGDDASSPRFIETVPKHGYRFVAEVELAEPQRAGGRAVDPSVDYDFRRMLLLGSAGTVGGGVAGVAGGLFYGFVGASHPLQAGPGAVSVVIVLMCLTILAALIGAAGVAFGIAAAGLMSRDFWQWSMVGGAFGGAIVGASAKLLGLDAFNLLVGQSPGDITGALEGALLGGAVGLGAWLASRLPGRHSVRRSAAIAGAAGATAGIVITLLGGRMMAGSLDLLARQFPGSRLRVDQLGALFGERGLGPVSMTVTGALEGALFGACLVAAMVIARRDMRPR